MVTALPSQPPPVGGFNYEAFALCDVLRFLSPYSINNPTMSGTRQNANHISDLRADFSPGKQTNYWALLVFVNLLTDYFRNFLHFSRFEVRPSGFPCYGFSFVHI
jgi:hypothetical protein